MDKNIKFVFLFFIWSALPKNIVIVGKKCKYTPYIVWKVNYVAIERLKWEPCLKWEHITSLGSNSCEGYDS